MGPGYERFGDSGGLDAAVVMLLPPVTAEADLPAPEAAEPTAKPKRSRKKAAPAEVESAVPSPAAANDAEETPAAANADGAAPADDDANNPDGTPRRGWWQRTFGA
jgi:ribonuclease E